MQDNQEKCKELAIRIYNLDEEVYKCVGSSLGRTFTGQKETTLRQLAALTEANKKLSELSQEERLQKIFATIKKNEGDDAENIDMVKIPYKLFM